MSDSAVSDTAESDLVVSMTLRSHKNLQAHESWDTMNKRSVFAHGLQSWKNGCTTSRDSVPLNETKKFDVRINLLTVRVILLAVRMNLFNSFGVNDESYDSNDESFGCKAGTFWSYRIFFFIILLVFCFYKSCFTSKLLKQISFAHKKYYYRGWAVSSTEWMKNKA